MTKLSVSCDNGVVRKVKGGWEVFPKTTGKAKINVTATKLMVKRKIWDSFEFRVMRTPKPEPKFLGSKNKKLRKVSCFQVMLSYMQS